ncbi:hypothetical protein EMCRGX_G024001 [Ephydatia muelleri]
MQDLAMALSATKDEKWMAIRMKLRLPEMEEFTVGDEMDSIVLFFEKLLRSIFQEADTSSGLSRINELSKDATLDAAVGLVRAVANAVQIIDGKMIMGSIASTLNSLYHQTEATLESVKPYLAIDGTMDQPGALDLTITSPLNSTVLSEASVRAGSAAQAAESRKHQASKCWVAEARKCLSWLANRLAVRMGWSLSKAKTSIYGRLSLALIRANARAILSSEIGKHGELKELETAIMGTYRQRVCDLNLQSEDVTPKTSAGKQLLSKFLRAQTMQDLAMALSATKDEKWMAIRMKLRLPEMEEFTPKSVGDEMDSIVLFFEKLLRSIFQEVDTSSGLSRINELSKDATLDAAVGLVRAVANAVQIIDGKMIMGSIVSTLNSLYHQTEATLESVKPYLAIDGTMGGVVG